MSFTVTDLLASKQFSDMHLVNDNCNVNAEIKRIRIIEVSDMEHFLIGGGALLLTSFTAYRNTDETEFRKHLEALYEKQIIGFIVKKKDSCINRRYSEILLDFCNEHNLPFIEIPESQHYWQIIKYVMNHIFDSDIARLTYFKLTHDNFTNMLMNAQAFSSATKKILSLLEEMIGNPISLYYANRRCFASTGEEKAFLSFNSTIHSYSPDIITRFRYQIQEKDGHSQYVVKVNVVDKNWVYLVIDETVNTLEPLDYMALENAIITLQYGFIGEYARNEMEKKYQKDIGYGLLTGTLTANEMDEVAHMLTLNEKSMYCVVSFHTIPHNKDGIYTTEQLNEVETIEEKIAEILTDEHIFLH